MLKITVKDLWKSYGEESVFQGFSTEISPGEITVLMGRSGCGKTTFTRILLGLEKADRGTVSGLPEKKSAVFQEDRLFEPFSAVSNIRAALGKKGTDREIRDNLEAVGLLGEVLLKPVSALSGGMRRRTAIVRAMMADSELVILDEPFEGLDPETKERTMAYVREQRRGRTLLLVTHNREEGEAMGGKFLIFKRGDGDGRED
ncbi:MAG: ABC transporter ATP-binding protein [Lachnospiraceae bacterium]|nr:ABC transporter ATP-binding protein [Lachnospiraceae bacterium]